MNGCFICGLYMKRKRIPSTCLCVCTCRGGWEGASCGRWAGSTSHSCAGHQHKAVVCVRLQTWSTQTRVNIHWKEIRTDDSYKHKEDEKPHTHTHTCIQTFYSHHSKVRWWQRDMQNKGIKRKRQTTECKKGEEVKDKSLPGPYPSPSLSIHFTLRPSVLSTVSQRMDPYLLVLNYACHNSIMKQRKDGQPRNWHGIGPVQRCNVISFWSMIIMIPQYAFRLCRPDMIYL